MTQPPEPARVLFVVGPTASGKHSIAMALAERLGAEILSLDSMKVYRGMDVGTAKPTAEARRRVPHHLVDVVDPPSEFSVAEYLALTVPAVESVLARGRVPLFAGGTGLYLRALTRGLFEGPATDLAVRARLLEGDPSTAELHARLAVVDPARAAAVHPNDRKRIVRALEVHARTGRPMSDWLAEAEHGKLGHPHAIFSVEREPADLADRIDRRTDRLFEKGFVEEVRRLDADPATRPGRQASQAVGYPEIRRYLAGEISIDACVEAVKQNTRYLARRQRTWFRSFPERISFPVDRAETSDTVAERMARAWAD